VVGLNVPHRLGALRRAFPTISHEMGTVFKVIRSCDLRLDPDGVSRLLLLKKS
jgi:hypothetical protein